MLHEDFLSCITVQKPFAPVICCWKFLDKYIDPPFDASSGGMEIALERMERGVFSSHSRQK